jgi:DNA invertase Pin-like site-specific DNA recombinase
VSRVAAARAVGYATLNAQHTESARQEVRKQADTIESECQRLGLSLFQLVREREPQRGRALERPGLVYALKLIAAGDAEGLVVAELSRLAHSVPELGRVLEWFVRSDARLIAASPELDTKRDPGRLTLQTIIGLSHWEDMRVVQRTRIGMQAARRRGPAGVADYPALRERIARMRGDGMTLQAIADRLNQEGVPTVRGGAQWRPSSVQTAAGYQRPAPAWREVSPRVNARRTKPRNLVELPIAPPVKSE